MFYKEKSKSQCFTIEIDLLTIIISHMKLIFFQNSFFFCKIFFEFFWLSLDREAHLMENYTRRVFQLHLKYFHQ